MKKLLALILALVMVMGLATVGTNAAAQYSDEADFNFEEAIDVMSSVGVLEGADGKFRPSVELKRSEAAKIVAYLNTNNKTAEGLVGVGKFSDVPTNHWAAGYIDYLTSIGVIAGQGENVFNPDGDLKVVDFAKMLLVVIGYDPKIEGLVGSDYQIYTTKLATNAGLLKGLKELNPNDVLTREQAAQMAFNTIKAATVEYKNKGGDISINGASINIGSSDATYVTTTIAKDQNIDDRKLTNATGVAADSGYTVEFGERQYPNLRQRKVQDDFKRPVNLWTNDKEEIGEYIDPDTVLGEYTVGVSGAELLELIGEAKLKNTAAKDIEYAVNGLTFTYADPTTVKEDMENQVLDKANDGLKAYQVLAVDKSNMIRSNRVAYGFTGNGVLTQVFERNEKFYITSILTYYVQATDDYNTKTGTVSYALYTADPTDTTKDVNEGTGKMSPTFTGSFENGSKLEAVDFPEITTLKKNDGFLARFFWNGKNWEAGEIKLDPKTTETATISKFSTGKDKNQYVGTVSGKKTVIEENAFYTGYVVSGSQYDYSRAVFLDVGLRNYSDTAKALDDTYDLVFDEYGYVIAAIRNKTPDKYVFLAGLDSKNSNIAASQATGFAIFSDGTEANITVDIVKTNKKIVDNTDANYRPVDAKGNKGNVTYYTLQFDTGHAYNRWFSYTTSGEGSSAVYTLTPVVNSQVVGRYYPSTPNASATTSNGNVIRFSAARTRVVGDYSLEYTNGPGKQLGNKAYYSYITDEDLKKQAAASNGGINQAWFNEKSTIITAKVGRTSATTYTNANYDFGIAEVSGIYTGIQGTDIVAFPQMDKNTKDTDYAKRNPFNAVAWTIYDKNGYVISAVVVGEDNGSAKSFLYATSGAGSEWKEGKYYYWNFNAIVDGVLKQVTLKTDEFGLLTKMQESIKFNDHYPKGTPQVMDGSAFYEARFDKDGYVVDVTRVAYYESGTGSATVPKGAPGYKSGDFVDNVYTTTDLLQVETIKETDTAFNVYRKAKDTVFANGQTLYANNGKGNGLAVQPGAPIFVVQRYMDKNTGQFSTVVTEWSSLDGALGEIWSNSSQSGSRTKITDFQGYIAAALDRGSQTAKWVVIKSTGTAVFVDSNKGSGPVVADRELSSSVELKASFTVKATEEIFKGGSANKITYTVYADIRAAGAVEPKWFQIGSGDYTVSNDTNFKTDELTFKVAGGPAKIMNDAGAGDYKIVFKVGTEEYVAYVHWFK